MILLLASIGWAHHGTATTQVSTPLPPAQVAETDSREPQLEVGTRYDLRRFDRVVQERLSEPADDPVSLHTLTVDLGAHLGSKTSFMASLPVGLVADANGTTTGAGDLSVGVRQGVGEGLVRATASMGMVAPTGRYDRTASHQGTDMQGLADGQLLITTYATRANLGAGTWSAWLGAGATASPGPARLAASLTLRQPLTETRDGLRWGTDVASAVHAGVALLDRVVASGVVAASWHGHDRHHLVDEDTGQVIDTDIGGRSSITAGPRVSVQLAEPLLLYGQALTPLWQHAEGIQLTAGASAAMGLTWRAPLSRRAPEPTGTATAEEPADEEVTPTVTQTATQAPLTAR